MPAASEADNWLATCMGVACGIWGWPPEVFWRATPFDVGMTFEGMQRLQKNTQDFGAEDAKHLRALLDEKKR